MLRSLFPRPGRGIRISSSPSLNHFNSNSTPINITSISEKESSFPSSISLLSSSSLTFPLSHPSNFINSHRLFSSFSFPSFSSFSPPSSPPLSFSSPHSHSVSPIHRLSSSPIRTFYSHGTRLIPSLSSSHIYHSHSHSLPLSSLSSSHLNYSTHRVPLSFSSSSLPFISHRFLSSSSSSSSSPLPNENNKNPSTEETKSSTNETKGNEKVKDKDETTSSKSTPPPPPPPSPPFVLPLPFKLFLIGLGIFGTVQLVKSNWELLIDHIALPYYIIPGFKSAEEYTEWTTKMGENFLGFCISQCITTEKGREFLLSPACLNIIVSVLSNDKTPPDVIRSTLFFLSILTMQPYDKEGNLTLCSHFIHRTDIMDCLLSVAHHPNVTGEVVAADLMLLKTILAENPNGENSCRTAFLSTVSPLYFISRASRSTDPNVVNSAQELSLTLLHYLRPFSEYRKQNKLSQNELTSLLDLFGALGQGCVEHEMTESAIIALEYADSIQPSIPAILPLLAQAYYNGQRYEDTVRTVRRAMQIKEEEGGSMANTLRVQWLYMESLQELGKLDEAYQANIVSSMKKIIKSNKKNVMSNPIESHFNSLLQPQVYKLLIDYYKGKKQWDEAEDMAKEWMATFPLDFNGFYQMGKIFLSQRKYPEALTFLEQAYVRDTARPEIFYYESLIHYKMGNMDKAKELITQCIETGQNNESEMKQNKKREFESIRHRERIQGKGEKELTKIPEKVLDTSPSNYLVSLPSAHFLKGKILFTQGDIAGSLTEFQHFESSNPPPPPSLLIDSLLFSSDCYQKLGKTSDAFTQTGKALHIMRDELVTNQKTKSEYFKERPKHKKYFGALVGVCAKAENFPEAKELQEMCRWFEEINKRK